MAETTIVFDDGAAYESMMGTWSRIVGEDFLSWLEVPPQRRWIDVGCGNGAFTELIVDRASPAAVDGIDPSEGQLSYARTRRRPSTRLARYRQGGAMDLPYPDESFDAAVMALVLFFVPEPSRGVAEMARVVAPGGTIAAYAWDFYSGGFPLSPFQEEVKALGGKPTFPPSVQACRAEVMQSLWEDAGLTQVETRRFTAERTFDSFDEYWRINLLGPSLNGILGALTAEQIETLRHAVKARTAVRPDGTVIASAWANAVKGRKAG